jgi:hypothetical protein
MVLARHFKRQLITAARFESSVPVSLQVIGCAVFVASAVGPVHAGMREMPGRL